MLVAKVEKRGSVTEIVVLLDQLEFDDGGDDVDHELVGLGDGERHTHLT